MKIVCFQIYSPAAIRIKRADFHMCCAMCEETDRGQCCALVLVRTLCAIRNSLLFLIDDVVNRVECSEISSYRSVFLSGSAIIKNNFAYISTLFIYMCSAQCKYMHTLTVSRSSLPTATAKWQWAIENTQPKNNGQQ